MTKIYHLGTCDTCRKIIAGFTLPEGTVLQDIKKEAITELQLEEMRASAGSYEALFSRKSQKYRAQGLHEQQLTEDDYKRLILEEYTFLRRPVVMVNGKAFVGNSKESVSAASEAMTQR